MISALSFSMLFYHWNAWNPVPEAPVPPAGESLSADWVYKPKIPGKTHTNRDGFIGYSKIILWRLYA